MEDNYKLKMAVISGASHALEMKARNPKASDEDIVQEITESAEEILGKIDEEGE
jgi:hypothetical protein